MATIWLGVLFVLVFSQHANGVLHDRNLNGTDLRPYGPCDPLDVTRQSPVYVNDHDFDKNDTLGRIDYVNYNRTRPNLIRNDGDTVYVSIKGCDYSASYNYGDNGTTNHWNEEWCPLIRNGGLKTWYRFEFIDFHWGADDWRGAEHPMHDNHTRYPLEMHIVHRHYDDRAPDGHYYRGVLVVFFRRGDHDFEPLEPIVKALGKVKDPDDEFEEFDDDNRPRSKLINLLPNDLSRYYRYFGSYTNKPCTHEVEWNLYREILEVSERQLEAFRRLETGNKARKGDREWDNFYLAREVDDDQKPSRSFSDD